MTNRAKNWILRPYLDSAHWIEEGSTILVTDTFCVLTSDIWSNLRTLWSTITQYNNSGKSTGTPLVNKLPAIVKTWIFINLLTSLAIYRKPNEHSPHQLILFPSAPPPGHLCPGLPSVLFPSCLHLWNGPCISRSSDPPKCRSNTTWQTHENGRLKNVWMFNCMSPLYLLVHHDKLVTLRGDAPTLGAQATLLDYDRLSYSRLEPTALPPAGESTGVCKRCSHKQRHEKYGWCKEILSATWEGWEGAWRWALFHGRSWTSVQCTVYSVQCRVYPSQPPVHSIQCHVAVAWERQTDSHAHPPPHQSTELGRTTTQCWKLLRFAVHVEAKIKLF